MKLESLAIKNYRCFDELQISLHPEMTILIAPNSAGKTTILDAARIAVWPFVKAFDLGSQAGKSATIQVEDVRLVQDGRSMEPRMPSSVTATGTWLDNTPRQWNQERNKIKPRTNTTSDKETRELTRLGASLQRQVWDQQAVDLPLVVYLGTGRLWYQGRYTSEVPDKKLNSTVHSRLWGYQNCMTATSSYKQFEQWYIWICKGYREQQLAQLEDSLLTLDPREHEKFKSAMTVVQEAVNTLTEATTGWRNLRYIEGQQQLMMEHAEHGRLPLARLSDGLRNMIVLISDIAFRCIKLNPHMKSNAAKKTQGIVMIDEVDLFLHPSWQQTVIGSLREAFPLIQFIVTTHSPQVLTTVGKESIRIVSVEKDAQSAKEPDFSPLAHESGDALARLMETHKAPDLGIKDKLHSYEQHVRNGKENTSEAQKIFRELESMGYEFDESDIDTWRFLARNKKRLKNG